MKRLVLAALILTIGACSSEAPAPEQAEPAGIGHVKQAVTYPWTNPVIAGGDAGNSTYTVPGGDANQFCAFQQLRGSFRTGSIASITHSVAGNVLKTYSTLGIGSPRVGAICVESSAFTFTGTTGPVLLDPYDNTSVQSTFNAATGNFTALDFTGPQLNHISATMPILQDVEGFMGDNQAGDMVYGQLTRSSAAAQVQINRQNNCNSQPTSCGQKAGGNGFRLYTNANGYQNVTYAVTDYAMFAPSSTGAQTLHDTTLPATDGICFISSVANAWYQYDYSNLAFVYVNASGNWAFSVGGKGTGAAFSCVKFAN